MLLQRLDFRGLSLAVVATLACSNAVVSTSNTIEFRHDLPPGFLAEMRNTGSPPPVP